MAVTVYTAAPVRVEMTSRPVLPFQGVAQLKQPATGSILRGLRTGRVSVTVDIADLPQQGMPRARLTPVALAHFVISADDGRALPRPAPAPRSSTATS